MKASKLTIREVVLFGVLGALTFALKMCMALLPNIEPVSLLVMVFAAVFGLKALYPVYVYVAMEILFYGLGLWNLNYLYIRVSLSAVKITGRARHVSTQLLFRFISESRLLLLNRLQEYTPTIS